MNGKRVLFIVLLPLAGLVPYVAVSQAAELTVGKTTNTAVAAKLKNLCAKGDRIVFLCMLRGSKKSAALCVSGNVSQGQGRFYYAYGRPSALEFVFPSVDEPARDAFARTYLRFAGNTGGYAYSFVNKDYKYIIYSVSGSFNFLDAGVIVQRVGDLRALKEMRCQNATVVDPDDHDLFDVTSKWKEDDDLSSHGLPRRR